MNIQKTYDSKTIIFHWLSAVIILGLWIAGQTIDLFPKGTPRITVRSFHITFGIILIILLTLRINWRLNGGIKLPQAIPGVLGKLAVGTHQLLYVLMASVVTLGIAAVWIRGDNIFNLFTIPAFDASNKQLREDVVDLHGLFANALLILAGLHALIAIWHHKVIKDDVLSRIWPKVSNYFKR